MAQVRRAAPNFRAKPAGRASTKKNQVCAPFPERERSKATGMPKVSQTSLRAAQSRAGLKAVEESVALEVRNALRALETRYQQVEVARKGVSVAAVLFESYDKRLKLGLATTPTRLECPVWSGTKPGVVPR